jgi:hypothetical protein
MIDGSPRFIEVEVLAQDSRHAIVKETGQSADRLAKDQQVVMP